MEQKSFRLAIVIILAILVVGILYAVNKNKQPPYMSATNQNQVDIQQSVTGSDTNTNLQSQTYETSDQLYKNQNRMTEDEFLAKYPGKVRNEIIASGVDINLPASITHTLTSTGDFFGIAPDPISGHVAAAQSIYFFKGKTCAQVQQDYGNICTQYLSGSLVAGVNSGIIGDLYKVLQGMYR